MITERQVEILERIVQEYIIRARPVSSQLLEKKHDFGMSSATIRNEMQKLADRGYLSQPHTSAGRLPTDKGYRFFVDRLLEKELAEFETNWQKEIKASFEFIREITEFLAGESSNLALGYLSTEGILWKEGWREVFREPEFLEAGYIASFIKALDDLERNIERINFPSEIRVYIGRESPVSENKDFSLITLGFNQGLFALLGPKRMSYHKNISLLLNLCQKI
jgi:heat-inducible transcriptional repressor